MYKDIPTPSERRERSRRIIPARNPQHEREMTRQDLPILADLLAKRKRLLKRHVSLLESPTR